tara:strand:+ start:436 stop:708 length:273 start_codon:yes stop_codon:yes gene_type:complete
MIVNNQKVRENNMKYQIQQLMYEYLVFWHNQYNGDYSKICKMVYISLQNHFQIDHDRVDNYKTNFDTFLIKNNYTDVYLTFKRDYKQEGK